MLCEILLEQIFRSPTFSAGTPLYLRFSPKSASYELLLALDVLWIRAQEKRTHRTDLWSEDRDDFQKHLGTPSPAGGELVEQVRDCWQDRCTTWRRQTLGGFQKSKHGQNQRERSAPALPEVTMKLWWCTEGPCQRPVNTTKTTAGNLRVHSSDAEGVQVQLQRHHGAHGSLNKPLEQKQQNLQQMSSRQTRTSSTISWNHTQTAPKR